MEFNDIMNAAVRELAKRTKITTLIQSVLINGMCLFVASSRNGGERLSAELDERSFKAFL